MTSAALQIITPNENWVLGKSDVKIFAHNASGCTSWIMNKFTLSNCR